MENIFIEKLPTLFLIKIFLMINNEREMRGNIFAVSKRAATANVSDKCVILRADTTLIKVQSSSSQVGCVRHLEIVCFPYQIIISKTGKMFIYTWDITHNFMLEN